MTASPARLIDLPKLTDPRGALSFVESERHVPFPVARVFYLYDIAEGSSRGGHAHRELHQFIIAMNGSFSATLDDGQNATSFSLTRRDQGLYVPPMTWVDLEHFSSGAVCIVLASHPYDEADYLRSYDAFTAALAARGG